jgi:putative transposase
MHIVSGTVSGALRLARIREVSREARLRLQWMDYYQAHGRNAALSCRHIGISRQTFYRWKRRYRPGDLTTLESRSHRPRRLRQPTWSPELSQKDKLVVLLRREEWQVSTSMVGRILKRLKERGVLREPLPNAISARRRHWPRPYAVRKPREYSVQQPGDLVQVDTLDVRPLPGVILKHFTARDVVSRWDVVKVRTRATATTAAGFLEAILARTPFPVRALQVDGGSEFQADFEQACQERGIRLFALPPRSPKLNGCVERAQRTHREEFYEVYDGELESTSLSRALQDWEQVYNQVPPRGYPTSPRATSPPTNSSPAGSNNNERRSCVTNLLDENTPLTMTKLAR